MSKSMHRLLAFDTSTETLSVAVQHGDRTIVREGAGGAQSSSTLLPLIQSLLAEAGLELASLDAIAFGRGPGSFTGLRTACSVAQGLGFGAGVRVLPVDTLLAVAEEARHRHGAQRVVALLDARMSQVYAAHYDFTGVPEGDAPLPADPQLLSPEQVQAAEGWTLAGNAFGAYDAQLPGGLARVEALPTASALLRLAPGLLAQGLDVAPAQAWPLYVRDKVALTTAEREAAKTAALPPSTS
ncbi:tRNA (adenosine(37)-N6)-threonylcarbamoyltransferase complex dimerization subunit type 1 TsaB [Variovorax dokdonensis]|uniref:tRNA (Adenosine(37)-N6)-threonylcarbamoyltransferase complex dimerization subunit type 1 TsaB n=1 Tax=Variovorax dokdonensis TaxID=344883 RepID=A0ABT7N9V8_9BURK|nr:tRNA (adenosine(37)-N6)-threonylcarbamoyltransferase complex dimerization subunit type 1 TsaB [Variovorax dokdonensis]MDM0044709.1 tRNA (adenosine(37)-N6)-threonylcarbamoyltransferase complex dimerization subunit type 1 TsaB [Variovorax dokdonensis]